jgi:hypothetical protein
MGRLTCPRWEKLSDEHILTESVEVTAERIVTQINRDGDRLCWLGFVDRRECPNMCAGCLCGYAKS